MNNGSQLNKESGVSIEQQILVPLSDVHMQNICNHSTGLFSFHINTFSSQKSLAFAGCWIWNSLLRDVWTSQTMEDFKLKFRKHL